jgi:hypothetical protein
MVTEQMATPYTDREDDEAERAKYTAHYRALLADKTPVPNWSTREADLLHMWAMAVDGVTMRRVFADGYFRNTAMCRVRVADWVMD